MESLLRFGGSNFLSQLTSKNRFPCRRFSSLARGQRLLLPNHNQICVKQHGRLFKIRRQNVGIRETRRSIRPVETIDGSPKGYQGLFRPFVFTISVCGASFVGAAIWQYESVRSVVKNHMRGIQNKVHQRFYGKAGSFRHRMNAWWNDLTPGQQMVATLIGLNCGVFLMWQLPLLRPLMLKWFSSSPMSGAPCWSMLLSNFSHFSLLHLGANMYVLWSFTPTVSLTLGREQFLAVFLSAGVISSFTSYLNKVAIGSMVPSLGASGAILALIGIVCTKYPDARLSIAFVDQLIPHSFSATHAAAALLVFDTLGLLLRWRLFDHAAHLGGLIFGIMYMTYGQNIIWKGREPFIKWYHQWFRGRP